ncbi:MAG: TetR/AcrR family transcriptional regulator [Colwellia sp.]|nr:TetR/AcrR family transcriptional regulator [Colwellia sp.]
MAEQLIDKDIIFQRAVELAHHRSWQSFSIIELATALNCSMSDIKCYFRSKDDIAELFFDRADDAMLSMTSANSYFTLSVDERLLECIMCWFQTLAPDKNLIREILTYKLELGHFHLQAHSITRISRTVQWFLEVSGREHKGICRTADEIAVTSAYLASFRFFLLDQSDDHKNTRTLLKQLIRKISRTQGWVSHLYYLVS